MNPTLREGIQAEEYLSGRRRDVEARDEGVAEAEGRKEGRVGEDIVDFGGGPCLGLDWLLRIHGSLDGHRALAAMRHGSGRQRRSSVGCRQRRER